MKSLFFNIHKLFILEAVLLSALVVNDQKTEKNSEKINLILKDQRPEYSDQYIKEAFSEFKSNDKDNKRFSSTELSSNIVMIVKDRPLLKSWLYQRSANIYTSNKQYSDAVDQLVAATNCLDTLYADVVVDRQAVLNKLGNLYLLKGDKENADKAFLAAYSFPYWTFPRISLDSKRRVEIAYRRAIRGLILARAGNLQKLKEIRIIPAANDLRPKLEEAIKRAEGKLDE